jgi:metal-sulfur cluster biosynthetic enzyme
LALEADAPAHGQAIYVTFCGNPAAELPEYPSELRVGGEGVGLKVENPYYIASLSQQSGQMERLTAKWHTGFLELYINAYAHGEPPNIDWAHDYLASEHYQKSRVTSWDACPNADVVRGPLCTIVRRFGFPAGPTHPLFTPSRLLMDLSYTFYAVAPYFLKVGRMQAVQDFTLNYARDDEWLFAGRPFTDALWMDEAGRVHEGPVPPEHTERVWGQGFYNRDGRESIFAIWLAHRVEAPAGAGAQATAGVTLHHEGSIQLDYSYTAGGLSGHSQIWNRAHLRNPRLTAGVAVVQRNAYLFAPYPAGAGAAGLEMLRQRLLHPLVPSCAADELAGEVATAGSDDGDGLARKGERSVDWGRKRAIWEALRKVPDEEFYKVDANVVDMGYVYDVRLRGEDVHVLMTMPRRGRPKHNFLANPMRARVEQLAGVRSVVVDLTWEPAWTPNRLSAAGRQAMGPDG